MAAYGDQIGRLKLVQAIQKAAGRDDLSEFDAAQLHAMVLNVADAVGDLLAAIPMTFRQYTKHDLLHARNLIDLMGRFIPAKTLKQLNAVELAVLALVAMLHDFGMYVEEGEKAAILDGQEFGKLLDAMPDKKRAIDEAEAAGRPYLAHRERRPPRGPETAGGSSRHSRSNPRGRSAWARSGCSHPANALGCTNCPFSCSVNIHG